MTARIEEDESGNYLQVTTKIPKSAIRVPHVAQNINGISKEARQLVYGHTPKEKTGAHDLEAGGRRPLLPPFAFKVARDLTDFPDRWEEARSTYGSFERAMRLLLSGRPIGAAAVLAAYDEYCPKSKRVDPDKEHVRTAKIKLALTATEDVFGKNEFEKCVREYMRAKHGWFADADSEGEAGSNARRADLTPTQELSATTPGARVKLDLAALFPEEPKLMSPESLFGGADIEEPVFLVTGSRVWADGSISITVRCDPNALRPGSALERLKKVKGIEELLIPVDCVTVLPMQRQRDYIKFKYGYVDYGGEQRPGVAEHVHAWLVLRSDQFHRELVLNVLVQKYEGECKYRYQLLPFETLPENVELPKFAYLHQLFDKPLGLQPAIVRHFHC